MNRKNDTNLFVLIRQTVKDVENVHRDIAGFYFSNGKVTELCRETRKNEVYLFIFFSSRHLFRKSFHFFEENWRNWHNFIEILCKSSSWTNEKSISMLWSSWKWSLEWLHIEGGKSSTCDDKLVFENSFDVFSLKGFALKNITEHKINTEEFIHAKLVTVFMHEMHFDTHGWSRNWRKRIFQENSVEKKASVATELGGSKNPETNPQEPSVIQRVAFLSENPHDLCYKLRLIIHE